MRIGNLWGLQIRAARNAAIGVFLVQAGYSSLAYWLLHQNGWASLGFGLLAALLHWLAILIHHLGHAWAGRRSGYPMSGIYFHWLLAVSRYPRNEAPLPASTHIRRALGGPLISLGAAILAGAAWRITPAGSWAAPLLAFWALDHLLIFCLGALLPLPFTDGGTILHYLRRKA